MNLTELKEKPINELVEMAEAMGIENVARSRKQDVIFSLLKRHAKSGEEISGDGVLDFNKWYLKSLLDDGKTIPIITNMCSNFKPLGGVTKINVHADAVAAKLAAGMGAHRLLMCSDVPGVLDENKNIIPEIARDEVEPLVKRGVLSGGMLVKVNEAFTTASRMGDDSAVIIMDEKFLIELLTQKGRGTMFRASALTQ